MKSNDRSYGGAVNILTDPDESSDKYGIIRAMRAGSRGRIIFNTVLFDDTDIHSSDKVGSYNLNTLVDGKEKRYHASFQ